MQPSLRFRDPYHLRHHHLPSKAITPSIPPELHIHTLLSEYTRTSVTSRSHPGLHRILRVPRFLHALRCDPASPPNPLGAQVLQRDSPTPSRHFSAVLM